MSVSVCPSASCHAPVERVWSLLADPAHYDAWMDARIEGVVPPGTLEQGQQILLRAPVHWPLFHIRLVVERVDRSQHVVELHGEFPFGFHLQTRIAVAAIEEATTSRVQFG